MEDANTAPHPVAETTGLSQSQLTQIAALVAEHMKPLLDGKWDPSTDVPAAVKVLLLIGAALALSGFGIESLAHAWLMSQGLGG